MFQRGQRVKYTEGLVVMTGLFVQQDGDQAICRFDATEGPKPVEWAACMLTVPVSQLTIA